VEQTALKLNTEFNPSDGWICLKNSPHLSKKVCGELKRIDPEENEDKKENNLTPVTSKYALMNTFNTNDHGFFYNMFPEIESCK
jgi:hypothetical protein